MQYPSMPEGSNAKAMARLVYRLAFVATKLLPKEKVSDNMQVFKATRSILGYDAEEAIRGGGDYSYWHYFPTIVCAGCGRFHKNSTLLNSFFITKCCLCTPFSDSVKSYEFPSFSLHRSTLSDLPMEVANELRQIILKEERDYYFGD